MSKICPCCGQQVPDGVAKLLLGVQMPPIQRRLVTYLYRHFGQCVRTAALINELWWDDPDGGPYNAKNCASVHILHLRRRLAPLGLEIKNHHGHGFKLRWSEAALREQAA